VSNDVRRFEDAGCFWIFLFAGPLECLAVVIVLWQVSIRSSHLHRCEIANRTNRVWHGRQQNCPCTRHNAQTFAAYL
jgi:hypothetical protein